MRPAGGGGLAEAARRALLRLQPRRVREARGEEWLRFVALQRGEARYAGRGGALRYWRDVAWDAARSGVGARIHGLRTREVGVGRAVEELAAATRSLARKPGLTALVVGTLAVGIGATTSIFSLANWVVLRPVPGVAEPDGLVTVRFRALDHGGWFLVSHPDYEDLVRDVPALASTAAVFETEAHIVVPGTDAAVRRPIDLVTRGFAETLGLRPTLGRPPGGTDGTAREVMVSHRFWRNALGGDRDAVGRTLVVNGDAFTVVGVGPRGFRGSAFPHRPTDLWFPVETHRDLTPMYPDDLLSNRGRSFYFTVLGRLAGDATAEGLQEQLRARRDALAAEHGDGGSMGHHTPFVQPGLGIMLQQQERVAGTVWILLAVVACLLVLACANAGNLLLGRGLARRTELAVRAALGASRARIARLLVVEGVLLALAAGLLGVGIALGGAELFRGERLVWFLPVLEPISLDGRVLAFALALSVGTGVLFSLAPAVALTAELGTVGRGGQRARPGRSRLRSGLVVAQIALALSLVVGSGLLLGTVRSLQEVELGFEPDGLVEGTVDPGTQGYARAEIPTFWRALLEETRRAPGVGSAGLAWGPLHGRARSDVTVRPEGAGEEADVSAYNNYVTDGFIGAAGLALVAGRDFGPDEMRAESPPDVVIVSEALVDALFPDGNAVGRHVAMPWREGRRFEIVGVVADARLRSLRDEDAKVLLEPFGQAWMPTWATVYARSAPGAAGTGGTLRRTVARLDPALPMYDVQPVEGRLRSALSEERVLARTTGLFAALALFLSGVGLYGVMAQTVNARRRELGIRMALGASGAEVRRRVLGLGAGTTLAGLAVGGALSVGVSRLVAERLWGVSPLEPGVLGTAVAVLCAAALLACWVPARRATRTDPVEALREE